MRSKKIRDSARDAECMLRLPGVCRGRTDTVVWAHSNLLKHGKGRGLKASDEHGAYACYECHAALDGHARRPAHLTRSIVLAEFERAMAESREALVRKGIVNAA